MNGNRERSYEDRQTRVQQANVCVYIRFFLGKSIGRQTTTRTHEQKA